MTALTIIARFHARPRMGEAVAAAIREVRVPTEKERGCLAYEAYRSASDPRLFFIHSVWKDEAAFERHARLPHTARFIQRVERLIDHDLDVNRLRPLGPPKAQVSENN